MLGPASSGPLTASASAVSTVSRSARVGALAAIVSGSAPASTGSISTATTRAGPASSRARVSEPRPGPTSSTTSSGPTAASEAIFRTVPASMTKFWPRRLDGRTPSRPASALTSPGPSSLTSTTSATPTAGTLWLGPGYNRHVVTTFRRKQRAHGPENGHRGREGGKTAPGSAVAGARAEGTAAGTAGARHG